MQTGQNRPGIAASWLLARHSGLTTGFQKTSAFRLSPATRTPPSSIFTHGADLHSQPLFMLHAMPCPHLHLWKLYERKRNAIATTQRLPSISLIDHKSLTVVTHNITSTHHCGVFVSLTVAVFLKPSR